MGVRSKIPKEVGFDTYRERNSIWQRQIFAKWGKKCVHDDFTLEV